MESVKAKSIVTTNLSGDKWFGLDYGMNIYRGCSHGCIYCDSRSSCYQIVEFDKVRFKENAIEIINSELKNKRKKGVIGIGAMSDPYNPLERNMELTRKSLELVDKYKFGISLITKSSLITRDIDILKKIQEHSPVIVKVTVTTYDDNLCKKIEQRVDVSSKRFEAIKELSNNGIYVGVLLMPILPFINDTEDNIRNIIRKSYECGAKFVFSYGLGVTLRHNQREYYYEQLRNHFGDKNLVKKYNEIYGDRYVYPSLKSKEL